MNIANTSSIHIDDDLYCHYIITIIHSSNNTLQSKNKEYRTYFGRLVSLTLIWAMS